LTTASWPGAISMLLGVLATGYLVSRRCPPQVEKRWGFWHWLFITLLGGIVLNSWLLLVLAELGLFTLPVILTSWILLALLAAWLARHRSLPSLPPALRLSASDLVPLALLVLTALLAARPADSLAVLDDSAIYLLGGIELADTGALLTRDSLLESIDTDLGGELLFAGPVHAGWTRHWGQFYIWNWGRPWVSFGLLHLQRIWCGLFTLFLGPLGGLWVAPAFGLLATLGLCLLGATLFSPPVGVVGTLLLSLNFVQWRYLRYPVSEILTQALVVGGFYLLAAAVRRRRPSLALLAGLCLSALFVARIDALFVCAVGGASAWLWLRESSHGGESRVFAWSLCGGVAYASFHNFAWAWPYLNFTWQTAGSPTLLRLGGLAISAGILLLVAGLRYPKRALALSQWLSANAWRLAGYGLGLSCILLAVLRALNLRGWSGAGIDWLAQYWTLPGMLLAGAGVVLMIHRRPTRLALPFLCAAAGYLFVYSLNPMVNPVHPWAMRRFVPVVMPALALLTAYGLANLPHLPYRLHQLAAGLMVLALAITFVSVGWPYLRFTEYAGLSVQLEQLSREFEPEALVLFDPDGPGSYLTQPLAYAFDRNTFVIQKARPDSSVLTPFVRSWIESGNPVYLVTGGGSLDWHPQELSFPHVKSVSLVYSRIQRTIGGPPSDTEVLRHFLDIYRVVPAESISCQADTASGILQMAAGEYAFLRGGFYSPEVSAEGLTFRWTDGSASVALPQVRGAMELALRVAAGRPDTAAPATLSLEAAGTPLLRADLPAGFSFQILEVTVPAELCGADCGEITLALHSDTWDPSLRGDSSDPRALGIMVDWIQWQPAAPDE